MVFLHTNSLELVHKGDDCVVHVLGTPCSYLINSSNRPCRADRWDRRLTLAWGAKPVFLVKQLEDTNFILVPQVSPQLRTQSLRSNL